MWDLRKLQPLHTYFSRAPATALDISQRGLLAVGSNRRVQVRGALLAPIDYDATSPSTPCMDAPDLQ